MLICRKIKIKIEHLFSPHNLTAINIKEMFKFGWHIWTICGKMTENVFKESIRGHCWQLIRNLAKGFQS